MARMNNLDVAQLSYQELEILQKAENEINRLREQNKVFLMALTE